MTLQNLQIFDTFRQQFTQATAHVVEPSPAEIYQQYDISLVSEKFLVSQPYEELFSGTYNINDRNVSAERP